jgi:predicted GIY-YIG superfamily endonuclease/catechol 2,3-dioxygenase-like lactoylglutathione lyase family enzyme
MLHCRGGYFYVGHTDSLERRLDQHERSIVPGFVRDHWPAKLVWSGEFPTRYEAVSMELRLKGWSRAKKLALIRGDWERISNLAKSKTSPSTSSGRTEEGEQQMFSHVMVGSNDVERSKKFYDSLLGKDGKVDDKGRAAYRHKGCVFMITKPIDGQQATHSNGGTIGFDLDSPEEVDAWHQRGVEAGGTSIEDPPGYRENAFGKLYLAYLRDPDGNKLCGLHRPEQ